jgi:hypothetical protein
MLSQYGLFGAVATETEVCELTIGTPAVAISMSCLTLAFSVAVRFWQIQK